MKANTYFYNHNNIYKTENFAFISVLHLRRTKWLFYSLCFYLLSQCFTIPILPIGTWATWLNLSDLATGLLVLTFLINLRHKNLPVSYANSKIFLLLILVLLASIVSYVSYPFTLR